MEQEEALSSSTTAETPEQSTTAVVPPKLHLHFLDLNGDAISGLDVRVTIWDLPKTYTTDCEGLIEDIEGPAGAKLRIDVQRFDGSFKLIDDCLMPASSNTWWQYLSPQVLLDVETVEHAGEKGDIKQSIPVAVPPDEGQRPAAQTDEAPVVAAPPTPEPAASPTPAPAPTPAPSPAPQPAPAPPPAKSPPAKTPATTAKAPPPSPAPAAAATASLPGISGKTPMPPREAPVKTGRTEQGSPMVVLQHKVLDWWNSWILPSLNLWGPHANAAQVGGAGAANLGRVGMQGALQPRHAA